MRLHAGSHVDAPEHNVRGGTQIPSTAARAVHGRRHRRRPARQDAGKAITEKDLEKRLDNRIRKGDRLLLRTDHNNSYDGGSETWMKESPYLTIGATMWCIEKGVVIVGYDFYHGNDEPNAPRVFHNSRTLSEHGIITMPYLKNLDRIEKDRFTLIGLPLKMIGAEASPIARGRGVLKKQAMAGLRAGGSMTCSNLRAALAALAVRPARAQEQFPSRLVTIVAPD
jgi:kynurenine formamidase